MFKTTINIKALQALHCGSDNQNTGNVKLHRREPFVIEPTTITTKFHSKKHARIAAIEILYLLWREIPSETRQQRKSSIYDEFFSALTISAFAADIPDFLSKFGAKFGIRGMQNDELFNMLSLFSDFEFLHLIRTELQYLFLGFRNLKETIASDEDVTCKRFVSMVGEINILERNILLTKNIEQIPVISGNSIRHSLRDLAMMFFFERMELIGKLSVKEYYEYFSGGALTDSTGKIEIDKRLQEVYMCPPLGLFGTAKGSDMIEGALNISHAVPRCTELGNGDISHWELTSFVFGTRSDILKDEKRMKVLENEGTGKKSDNPQQMLYWTESFVTGTELELKLAIEPIFEDMPLLISCLYHTLNLLKQNGYIGGKSSVAHGEIGFDMPFFSCDESHYLNYLDSRKAEIQSFFAAKKEVNGKKFKA